MVQIKIVLPIILMVLAVVNGQHNYGNDHGQGPYSQYRMRREIPAAVPASMPAAAGAQQPGKEGAQKPMEQAKFTPVRGPKEFSVNVADGIQGANQVRHEKWDNGTVTGMYANPLGNKKYQVIHYIADGKGYRITSSKVVDEEELMADKYDPNHAKKAQIDIDHDGTKTSYSVTPDQIGNASSKARKEKAGVKESAKENQNKEFMENNN